MKRDWLLIFLMAASTCVSIVLVYVIADYKVLKDDLTACESLADRQEQRLRFFGLTEDSEPVVIRPLTVYGEDGVKILQTDPLFEGEARDR